MQADTRVFRSRHLAPKQRARSASRTASAPRQVPPARNSLGSGGIAWRQLRPTASACDLSTLRTSQGKQANTVCRLTKHPARHWHSSELRAQAQVAAQGVSARNIARSSAVATRSVRCGSSVQHANASLSEPGGGRRPVTHRASESLSNPSYNPAPLAGALQPSMSTEHRRSETVGDDDHPS